MDKPNPTGLPNPKEYIGDFGLKDFPDWYGTDEDGLSVLCDNLKKHFKGKDVFITVAREGDQ